MKKKIAVLGLGLFGSSVARTLATHGVDVIAIDKNMNHVEEVMEVVEMAVQADFTKFEALLELGVGECDTAVIAVSEQLEVSIMAILALQKLNIPHIICKTKNIEYREVLLKIGVDRVILPETEMGVHLGNELSNTQILDLLKLDDRYNIIEFGVKDQWIGKKIEEIDFRRNYSLNIIAIKPQNTNEITIDIKPNYVLKEFDKVYGLTSYDKIAELF